MINSYSFSNSKFWFWYSYCTTKHAVMLISQIAECILYYVSMLALISISMNRSWVKIICACFHAASQSHHVRRLHVVTSSLYAMFLQDHWSSIHSLRSLHTLWSPDLFSLYWDCPFVPIWIRQYKIWNYAYGVAKHWAV